MKVWEAPTGVGAVNVVPETPDPENVPPLPALAVNGVTGDGVAVNVLVSPAHILAFDDVIVKLLFCRTRTVIEAVPPGWQLY